jgi:hypothetical protein
MEHMAEKSVGCYAYMDDLTATLQVIALDATSTPAGEPGISRWISTRK